jgi:hypothetical protein
MKRETNLDMLDLLVSNPIRDQAGQACSPLETCPMSLTCLNPQ